MATTEPIRQISEIEKLKNYFLEKGENRNYAMVTIGMNTTLRISDILNLTWADVYNEQKGVYKKHLRVLEQKTGKENIVALNDMVINALELLRIQQKNCYMSYFIFQSRCGNNRPICRSRAYMIIRTAAQELGIEGIISCHSLRKTFGYQAWKKVYHLPLSWKFIIIHHLKLLKDTYQ